jgi:hypothetical protein
MLHEQETINKNIKGYKPDFKVPVHDPTIEKTKEVDAEEASNNKKLKALDAEDQKKKDDASEANKKSKGSIKSGSLRDDLSHKTTSAVVVKETEYISYRQELYKEEPVFKPEKDFIDIYIDSGRYFPNNLSVIKICAQILNDQGKPLFPMENCICLSKGDIYNPGFNFKFTMNSPELLNNARVFLHVMYLTAEFNPNKPDGKNIVSSLFAHSLLNLFVNDGGKICEKANQKCLLNVGGHQVNLLNSCGLKTPIAKTVAKFCNQEAILKIPAASLLVRILKSGIYSEDPADYVDAPSYTDGTYGNQNQKMLTKEMELIKSLKFLRQPIKMIDRGFECFEAI